MIGSFTAVADRPRPKNNRLFRPRPERADRQKEAAHLQGLDPDFSGPFTRTLRARALRPGRPGEASERARVFFLLPVTHTCKSMESIQLFKLGSLHLHWQDGTNLLPCTYALMGL
jgi:hypothetical protein